MKSLQPHSAEHTMTDDLVDVGAETEPLEPFARQAPLARNRMPHGERLVVLQALLVDMLDAMYATASNSHPPGTTHAK